MAALTETKKKENETIEEFNKKFTDLVARIYKDIKPPDASILIYYIEAFEGEMRYQLRDKEPTTLHGAMEIAEKIDRTCKHLENPICLGFLEVLFPFPNCMISRENQLSQKVKFRSTNPSRK